MASGSFWVYHVAFVLFYFLTLFYVFASNLYFHFTRYHQLFN